MVGSAEIAQRTQLGNDLEDPKLLARRLQAWLRSNHGSHTEEPRMYLAPREKVTDCTTAQTFPVFQSASGSANFKFFFSAF